MPILREAKVSTRHKNMLSKIYKFISTKLGLISDLIFINLKDKMKTKIKIKFKKKSCICSISQGSREQSKPPSTAPRGLSREGSAQSFLI